MLIGNSKCVEEEIWELDVTMVTKTFVFGKTMSLKIKILVATSNKRALKVKISEYVTAQKNAVFNIILENLKSIKNSNDLLNYFTTIYILQHIPTSYSNQFCTFVLCVNIQNIHIIQNYGPDITAHV